MLKSLIVCNAGSRDLLAVKVLADLHRDELGFIPRAKLEEAIASRSMLIAMVESEPVAFVIYRHRKRDTQTTLYAICVGHAWQRHGFGRLLINSLYDDCKNLGRSHIQLKCPVDLPANAFYQRLGFQHFRIDPGRVRQLNVWRIFISI